MPEDDETKVPGDQAEALAAWAHRLQNTGARGLLILAGPRNWAEQLLGTVSAAYEDKAWHIPGDARVDSVLGQESSLVHQAADDALDVDLLAATAGSVRAGGLLIVTVPPVGGWRSDADQAVQRHLSHGWDPGSYGDRFLQRLRRLIDDHPEAWLLTPETSPALPEPASPAVTSATPADAECATNDQANAVAAVERTAHGRARRPLILAADRGRGKSTALGIAAQRLQAQNPSLTIVVTAPRSSSAERILERAALSYQAPDELLRHDHPADLLLVDEAAGIPIPTLLALSQRYARVVFATTVHGYEGTGRGFALRFEDHLRADNQRPRRLTLDDPIRWRSDDPLEALLNKALLLDAEPPEQAGELNRVERLDRDRLVGDETLLRSLFGLLVSAHYRTRPADLRQILDAPEITIHAGLDAQGQPLGVAISADEGPLPDALREAVWLGQRRVQGHLTPQSLASHAGCAEATSLAYRRILRIAVASPQRRQGIGRTLVEDIIAKASTDDLDGVSASFGATADLLAFWRALGMPPVRLGHRRDRASGTHSAIVLRTISDRARHMSDKLRGGLADQLRHHLPTAFSDLEAELVVALAPGLPATHPGEQDWWQVTAFAVGKRSRLDALPALTRLTWAAVSRTLDHHARDSGLDILILAALQQTDETQTARRLRLNGQRACEASLRDIVLRLAKANAPEPVRHFINQRTTD